MLDKQNSFPKPFLHWAGGKGELVPHILERVPSYFETYHEPFLGGGAVFFALYKKGLIKRAILSDINPELIKTYTAIKENPVEVIKYLKEFSASKDIQVLKKNYYTLRDMDISQLSLPEIAARFIFLNKNCFNGLYRQNKEGKFNVPFGRGKKNIYEEKNIYAVSKALEIAQIETCDFKEVLNKINENDFVYFDPPYIPLNKTSNFSSYYRSNFTIKDHYELKDLCLKLLQKNVYILLSNSSAEEALHLYSSPYFRVEYVYARRSINSKKEKRGKIPEILVQGKTQVKNKLLL